MGDKVIRQPVLEYALAMDLSRVGPNVSPVLCEIVSDDQFTRVACLRNITGIRLPLAPCT